MLSISGDFSRINGFITISTGFEISVSPFVAGSACMILVFTILERLQAIHSESTVIRQVREVVTASLLPDQAGQLDALEQMGRIAI